MRSSVLTVAGALSAVSGTPSCTLFPGWEYIKIFEAYGPAYERIWMWQYPPTTEDSDPVPDACYGRAKQDAETPAACSALCSDMNAVDGIRNAKVMCQNSPEILAVNNAALVGAAEGGILGDITAATSRNWYMWSSVVKGTSGWEDPGCEPDTEMQWGENLPGENQIMFEQEDDSADATAPDAAVWIMGNYVTTGVPQHGPTPYLAGVTASAPNPSDVFCMCQWDPYDLDNPCASSTYGCCDGSDITMIKTDTDGTNCVGGAFYSNSKEVSKAFDDAVAAAVGLGTGILVAVIVLPIVGLILLIVCIVCCCKHCGGGKPSA